ncbi:DUF2971 domain-containing protein [Aeromonas enteropelogenes]|uniref:DUF2971 domain-containing protein n=1 Tax=Aeromonas enteropelogenes TaxID=29489 RepID=UPI003987CD6E
MQILYKYSNYYGIESLNNPVLRLSPTAILNDPFENRLNEDVINNIKESFSLEGLGFDVNPNFPKHFETPFLMQRINEQIDDYGIVSLSETPRNLLMWAHYANEHKGICIGYKCNLFDSLPYPISNHISNAESYTPVKVNYDNIRPQVISENHSEIDKVKSYVLQQLTTKSDDWMYEKEHRCIIPIHWADEIKIIKDSDAYLDINQSGIFRDFINEGRIKKNENGNYDGELISAMISFYKNYDGAVFLKRIKKESIASIYLGCRFDQYKAEKIVSHVSKKESGLSHVKIYQCIPSPNRFEITPHPIYKPIED